MYIKELGEFGLIDRITKKLKKVPSVVAGPGDDCAVVVFDAKRYQLLTCDMLVEGVDFTAHDAPELIGRKAIAVSVSDIAACAGLPRHCLVSVGFPLKTTVAFVDKLMAGMLGVCRRYGIALVGGDISRSEKLVIDVSMTGLVEKKNLVLRSGARPGDLLVVTGALGGSRKGKQFTFTPRVKEARFLVEQVKVHAMIDISDGFVQDLGHILEKSDAGAVLYEELIPLSKDAGGLDSALYDGEDFELLFAVSTADARRIFAMRPGAYHLVGEVVDKSGGLKLIDRQSRERTLWSAGFRHF